MKLNKTEGWIIVNYGIAVYHTLSCLKRDAINSYGRSNFHKLHKLGAVDCMKVRLNEVL